MTDEKNLFINPTARGINGAFRSRNKGKGVDRKNIAESLDLVIRDNEKLSTNLVSSSKIDLSSEIEKNKLYHMKESERDNLAKQFMGLDRILYDRLREKTGKIQSSTGNIVVQTICGLSPIQVGSSAILINALDKREIQLEKSFSVDEVKEIVNELGIAAKNHQNTELATEENERNYKERVEELETENRKLWGEKNEITELRKKLIESYKRELSSLTRPLEIETEELDNLIRNYKKLYWAREKCNLRKIEVKEKKIGEIKKKLEVKVKNNYLEKEIFSKCEEIAELKFQSKQFRKFIRQLENYKAQTEFHSSLKN